MSRIMRKVICGDAIEQLRKIAPVTAIVTSLPDASEIKSSVSDYSQWFTETIRGVFESLDSKGVGIFYQSDRRYRGHLLSKAALLHNAAQSVGFQLLWHKIVLRNSPGKTNLYRPTYIHMMAFSRSLKAGHPTPDVIEAGRTIYRNGMNIEAAILAVRFAVNATGTKMICDPFCGRGTVLAVANALGIKSIGFDISPQECALARKLRISSSGSL
jgi:hypothetical protein